LRRGFKTLAEKHALEARTALKLAPIAPLDPWAYAKHLKVAVLDFHGLGLPPETVHQLVVADEQSWSAMTLSDEGKLAIVLNPSHAATRQRNDLTHELSHIELGHQPARVELSEAGLMLLSDYSDEQEQEADWRAAALLLPRQGLIHHRSRGLGTPEIAAHYGVSPQLCDWRLRTTGVETQLRRAYSR
jgi:Zn-dependent peptidase ImmA (M78 family)